MIIYNKYDINKIKNNIKKVVLFSNANDDYMI